MTEPTSLEPEEFEAPDLSKMSRSELEAEIVHLAKLCERFREGVANIVRAFEDEGDRVYLGSTNDADELRELDERLTDAGNELFMPWMNGRDLYADLLGLRTENGRLEGELRTAKTELAALRASPQAAMSELQRLGQEFDAEGLPNADAAHYGLTEEQAAEIEREPFMVGRSAEELIYIPGVWRCAKCGFRLVQSNLNAHDGTVTARDNPGEKCPNDGAPLWRVTYRDDLTEAYERWEEQVKRAVEAEQSTHALESENLRLREALDKAESAMREYYRYFTGGETRGSYDGKPEREGMWKAMHAARQALKETTDGE